MMNPKGEIAVSHTRETNRRYVETERRTLKIFLDTKRRVTIFEINI